MANIAQAPQQLQQIPNYGAQEASIKQKLALAKAIREGLARERASGDQIVGGRVIRNNPLAGALSGITGSIGNYEGNQGLQEQGELDDQKRQALANAVSGGNLDVAALAKSGVDPEQISKFAIAQQLQRSRPETWHQVFSNTGQLFMQSDKGNIRKPTDSETGQQIDFMGALYDPQAVYERSQAKGALDSFKTTDAQGREIIVTAGQANPPAYGKYSLPQQNMQQQMAQPQQQQPVQPAQQPMPDNQPQQMAQPGQQGEMVDNPEHALFTQAMDDVLGPGMSQKAFNGGQLAVTPEQDAAIVQRFNELKQGSQGTVQGMQQGIRGMSQAEKDALELKKAQGMADIDINKQNVLAETKPQAKFRGESINALPGVSRSTDVAIKTIDKLLEHPGLQGAVGLPNLSGALNLRGTPETDFKALLKQAIGQEFNNAFESLRGGGQITEIEGQKATQAMANLDTAQTEKQFKQALSDLKEEYKSLLELAYRKAGLQAPGNTEQGQKSNDGWSIKKVGE